MTDTDADRIPADARDRYAADGYLSLPGFLSDQELQSVVSNLDACLQDTDARIPPEDLFLEVPGDPETLKQVQRLHIHDPELAPWLTEGPFYRLAEAVLGEQPRPWNLQYFDKAPGANRPTPAHQDGAYFPIQPMKAVTIWLALQDVAVEQGCVEYLPGSQLGEIRSHTGSETVGFSRELALDSAEEGRFQAFPCAAGHALAHDARVIHRAGGNRSERLHRRALGFIYFAASCSHDAEADRRYQSALRESWTADGKLLDS